LKKLLKWIKRALRRKKSDIVHVMCPDCQGMVNPYEEHQCVVIEVQEIIYE
jgi:hypothetical protein